jgi:hypothetical protein
MRTEYCKQVEGSIPKMALPAQNNIEKLNFDEMCRFARNVLNCEQLGATAYYWADVCGVGVRWVRAWKSEGKAIHPIHVKKIVAELPKLLQTANSKLDYLRIWGARMELMFLTQKLKGGA